ncbi:RDD family protein [Myroides sp. 1354]|uniref:RDD family protein n=1 Tax=unclassified Myroides TaxID=2642485 RepID=UPI0025763057|nr:MULTISPECIES: RDD family protein [unclassified Myroides]MDM1044510.1 RDD family protein [Myroides sp. R163-1]MDM1056789.1 RDD family protein [Myroides sp. 1354]MDM1069940.1 RDD family protein [Myroides sp. 1372]
MAKLTINTTQNIEIDFKAASIGERILAFLLDMIFKILYFIVFYYLNTIFHFSNLFPDDIWSINAFFILISIPVIFYTVIFEVLMQGSTPGKKILGIKVIKIDGYQATVVDYFIRWIFRVIDLFIGNGIIAVISILATSKSQRLGDFFAGTTVISTKNRVSLSTTIFQEVEQEYKPLLPQVIRLSDADIGVVKEIYLKYIKSRDYSLIKALANKLESELKVDQGQLALNNQEFVELVLKDYSHFTGKE